jgi:PAS domain S-box-containing protein
MSVASRRARPAGVAPKKRNGGTLLETNERLQVLQQVIAAVHSTLDSEEVFQQITDAAVFPLGYTIAFVTVLNTEKQCFEIKALSAKNQLLPQMKKILGFSLSRLSVPAGPELPELNTVIRSLAEGRVVVVKTLAEIAYPVISIEVCSALQKVGGSKNYIVVPLRAGGGVAGAVYVSSPRDEVTEEELTMLQNFARAASQAIRNANLYTQAKQVQEQLRESEENLKTYLENAPDGVYLNDLKGNFLYGNKKAEEILGYEREELIGKSFLELNILPAKYLAKAGKLLALNATGRPTGPDEFELTRKDGSPRWVEISTAPIERGRETVVIGFVRDITERKEAEELYTTLANSSPASIYIGLDNKFTYVNPAFQEASGYTEKELLCRDLSTIVHPDDRESVRENVVQMLKGKRLQPYEFRFITKSGETGWALERVVPITYQGRPAILGVCINITERKQAELEYKAIIQTTMDGFWLVDMQGRFLDVNNAYCQLIGYSRDELLKMSIPDIEAIEKPEETAARIAKVMKVGGDRFETRHRCKDGRIVDVEVSVDYIDIGGGRMFVFVRDISDRKQAEEALKDSRRRFRDMVNLLPQIVWEIDTEEHVAFLNRQGIQSYGYASDESKEPFDPALAYVPEDRDRMKENTRRILNGEKLGGIEYTALRKDGSTFPVIVYAAPIIRGNKAVGLRGVTIDITERKQAEEALRQSEGKYATLVEQSTDGILIIRDGLVEFANSRLLEMASYSLDEVLGKPFLEFVAPAYTDMVLDRYAGRLAGEEVPNSYEIEILAKDGRKIPVEINASRIEYEGSFADMVIIRDITERKQAEELYATVANSSPVGIYIAVDNKYVFVNQTLQRSTGYTEKELLSIDPTITIHPEDRESARENAVRMLKGGSFEPYQYRFITKNGETKWAIGRVASITYGGRRATLGITMNITEYKQAEQLYHTLADSSPVGVYILQDGKFVFTNPAFQEATGFTDDDLLGREAPWIVHPEDRQRVMKNAIEMVKGKRFQPYEFRFITKSGETKWALERTASITYGGRRATLGNFLDITESKQAQERIQRAAEEWRTTFDSITDFISIHDKDNRLVRMNKALADAFKTTPQLLLGKVCHEVMHGTKEPPANCPYRQTLTTGKPATMEMFEPTLGIWIQESTSPIFNEKGEVTGSVHIVRDMSERKRMEEQLVMTDRLASIGELASGIAHELNNPLTSVIGFSQLLMEGNIPDNIKEDLGTVYSEAQRAATIVKNLLTFARKHASVKQLSQVNAIIEDVLRLRAYEQKVNNIEVDKRLATDLPEIMVDYFQMQQAFLNIIVNAESAMLEAHGKGKLAITTERVNGVIKVTFTDDGPGILKENMKRIFAPFFTTKEVGKGTGLGLSICHGIVSGHGGRIYAESEFGRGATFVVELPLNGH